jgi:hypothetical protein
VDPLQIEYVVYYLNVLYNQNHKEVILLKRSTLILLVLFSSILLIACTNTNEDNENLSSGYEYVVSDEPLPGFVSGVKSEFNVYEPTNVELTVGIGIPESAFLSDEDYKVMIVVKNESMDYREVLSTIDVESYDTFLFTDSLVEGNARLIEFSYEEVVFLPKEVFNLSDSEEGVLLIGYEVVYINQNDAQSVHFSSFQQVSYSLIDGKVILDY